MTFAAVSTVSHGGCWSHYSPFFHLLNDFHNWLVQLCPIFMDRKKKQQLKVLFPEIFWRVYAIIIVNNWVLRGGGVQAGCCYWNWPSLLLSWEDSESVEEDLSWYTFRESREEKELSQAMGCWAPLPPLVPPRSRSELASGLLPSLCNFSVSKRGH